MHTNQHFFWFTFNQLEVLDGGCDFEEGIVLDLILSLELLRFQNRQLHILLVFFHGVLPGCLLDLLLSFLSRILGYVVLCVVCEESLEEVVDTETNAHLQVSNVVLG